jgi:hypothetical protein
MRNATDNALLGRKEGASQHSTVVLISERLHALRALTTEYVRTAPIGPPSAPNLHRELGLTRTFAWKVSRFLTSVRHVEIIEFLLTPEGAAILAMQVERATADVASSRRYVETYAERHAELLAMGSLATLAALLRNAEGVSNELIPRSLLRDAFRANRVIWGVEATTLVRTAIITADPDDASRLRFVLVYFLHGLRLLRQHADCLISRERPTRVDMHPIDVVALPTVAGAASARPLSYIDELCSPEGVVVARRVSDDRAVTDAVIGLGVGLNEPCNLVKSDVYRRAMPRVMSPDHTLAAHSLEIRFPVQQVVIEQYCDPSLGLGEPRAEMTALLDGRPWYEAARSEKLAVPCEREEASGGMQLAAPAQCPGYERAMELVCGAEGIDLSVLEHVRVTYAHPPVPSLAAMVRGLAEE